MSKKKISEKVLNFFYKEIAFILSRRLEEGNLIKPLDGLKNFLTKRALAFERNVLDSDKINLLDLEACHEK